MSLPFDFARCIGRLRSGTADPECIDCQRRTDRPENAYRLSYMGAPKEDPCPERIAPEVAQ